MNLQNFSQLMTHSNIRFSVQSCCANNQFVFKYCPCKSAHWVIKVRYWVNTSLNALIFFFTNQREAENGGEFTYLFNRVICPRQNKTNTKYELRIQTLSKYVILSKLRFKAKFVLLYSDLRQSAVESFAHATTVQLSYHVQNFLLIILQEWQFRRNESHCKAHWWDWLQFWIQKGLPQIMSRWCLNLHHLSLVTHNIESVLYSDMKAIVSSFPSTGAVQTPNWYLWVLKFEKLLSLGWDMGCEFKAWLLIHLSNCSAAWNILSYCVIL